MQLCCRGDQAEQRVARPATYIESQLSLDPLHDEGACVCNRPIYPANGSSWFSIQMTLSRPRLAILRKSYALSSQTYLQVNEAPAAEYSL